MKRIRFVSCLIVLLLSILSMEIALGQEVTGVMNSSKASADYRTGEATTDDGYIVSLEVDGGYLHLRIPIGYQLQEYELSDGEAYPYSYVFIDEDARTQFVVCSSLESEKNQSILLRKLYDTSNRYIVFDDVMIGERTYIVYTKEQAAYGYGFLVRAGDGYSYQFHYALPYDSIQNEIPEEAVSILSTLKIYEDSDLPD